MTVLTQDDLKSLKEEICAQLKDEISTAISEMSTPNTAAGTVPSNAAFQTAISRQMQEHNREMKATMSAMQKMMMSMKRFVENAMPDIRDTKSESSHGPDELDFHCVTSFTNETAKTRKPPPSGQASDNDDNSDFLTQPTKRRPARSKGESPAAKRNHSHWDSQGGRGSGRGDGPSRGRGSDESRRSNRIKDQNSNSFQPLAMSDAQSYSGSN